MHTFNIYLLTEDIAKNIFYEKLTKVYEGISGNVIQVIMDDLNVKCERES